MNTTQSLFSQDQQEKTKLQVLIFYFIDIIIGFTPNTVGHPAFVWISERVPPTASNATDSLDTVGQKTNELARYDK